MIANKSSLCETDVMMTHTSHLAVTQLRPSIFNAPMLSSPTLGSHNMVKEHRKRSNPDDVVVTNLRPCQDTGGILGGSNAFQVLYVYMNYLLTYIVLYLLSSDFDKILTKYTNFHFVMQI